LIKHFPNNRDLEQEGRIGTILEYHSTNDFLQNFGGNLYNLYRTHFPLTPLTAGNVD